MSSSTSKKETSTKKLFIISPIGEPKSDVRIYFDKARRHIIDPIAVKNGYVTNRADKISRPGRITKQIIERLRADDLVIADLTGKNPNVFYELAVRHAIGKPVILMMGIGEQIPFDVAAQRVIFYDLDPDNIEDAKNELERQISEVESAKFIVDSPIEAPISLDHIERSGNGEQREIISILRNQSEQLRRLKETLHQQSTNARVHLGREFKPTGVEKGTPALDRLMFDLNKMELLQAQYKLHEADWATSRLDRKTPKIVEWASSSEVFVDSVKSQTPRPKIFHDDENLVLWFVKPAKSPQTRRVIAWVRNPMFRDRW